MNAPPILIDDAEYEAARRRVLGPWGAEIRERLQMTKGIPQGEIRKNNRQESAKRANHLSAVARQKWKSGTIEIPKNAAPVRHSNSIVVKLAATLRSTIGAK